MGRVQCLLRNGERALMQRQGTLVVPLGHMQRPETGERDGEVGMGRVQCLLRNGERALKQRQGTLVVPLEHM
jgi:hypothetical protein